MRENVDITGYRATYSGAGVDMSPAATCTDLFQLIGSATKIIRITRLQITADATAAGVEEFYIYKRTAANTGGTAVALTAIAHDSADPAYTAILQKYTANPSALGAGQIVRADQYALPVAGTTGYPFNPLIFTFGERGAKPIVLNGIAESLVINLSGAAVPAGLKVYADIEWTEDVI